MSFLVQMGLEEQAALGVEQHGKQEQGQIDDGNAQKLSREGTIFGIVGAWDNAHEAYGRGEVASVEESGGDGVGSSRDP